MGSLKEVGFPLKIYQQGMSRRKRFESAACGYDEALEEPGLTGRSEITV
jgi:hypothetical protein